MKVNFNTPAHHRLSNFTIGKSTLAGIALLEIVPIGLLVLRILFEEQFLRRELDGNNDYMKRVPYRLLPFIW